jgi:hypothetical protein
MLNYLYVISTGPSTQRWPQKKTDQPYEEKNFAVRSRTALSS